MMDAAQVRAARGLLDLTPTELSEMAAVSVATVKRIEAATAIRGSAEAVWKIQKALESAGIEFILAGEGKGPGVRLRRPGRIGEKDKR
jgi:predicted transcriptional regulator